MSNLLRVNFDLFIQVPSGLQYRDVDPVSTILECKHVRCRSESTQKLIWNLSPQSLCCLAEVSHCLFLIRLFLLLKRNLIITFYLTAKMTLSEPPVAFNLNRLGPYCATKKKRKSV